MLISPTLMVGMSASLLRMGPVTEQYSSLTFASRSGGAARRGPLVGGRCPRPGSSGPTARRLPPALLSYRHDDRDVVHRGRAGPRFPAGPPLALLGSDLRPSR